MNTKPAIVQWNKNGETFAALGVMTSREVCTVFEVSRQRQSPRNFVVREIECDASVEPPRYLRVIRRAEFKTEAKANAESALWLAAAEKHLRDMERACAASLRREAAALKSIGDGNALQSGIIKGEVARVRAAIKKAFARIFPRSLKTMDAGTSAPAETFRAYALDLIENSGAASGFPVPDIDSNTAAEIARAHKSFSRSKKKVESALIDLAIALHHLPPHNWRDWTAKEVADESTKRGFTITPAAVQERRERANLYCARESGPKMHSLVSPG